MNSHEAKDQGKRVGELRNAMLLARLEYLEGLSELRRLQGNQTAHARAQRDIKALLQSERAMTAKAARKAAKKPSQNPRKTQTKPGGIAV
jgi:hypothetical protein